MKSKKQTFVWISALWKYLPLPWLLNVIAMLLVGRDVLKYINSAKKKWIYINIFKGKENQVWKALRWCLLIPFYPTAALEKVESWIDKPLKKVNEHTWTVSTTAPLNHACGFEKEANIVNSVCRLTQSQVDRQVIGRRGGERERQAWSNHEN